MIGMIKLLVEIDDLIVELEESILMMSLRLMSDIL
jgi:hypothetical protein